MEKLNATNMKEFRRISNMVKKGTAPSLMRKEYLNQMYQKFLAAQENGASMDDFLRIQAEEAGQLKSSLLKARFSLYHLTCGILFVMVMIGITFVIYISIHQPLKLSRPIVSVDEGNPYLITWTEVKHATGYVISIGENMISTENTYFDIKDYVFGNAYTIKVRAIGDNRKYFDSDTGGILFLSPVQKQEK